MELKTFIAETLKQLVEGIEDAQKGVEGVGATINPQGTFQDGNRLYWTPGAHIDKAVQIVDFDILVTETAGDEKGARIGVLFSSVGLGAQGKSESGSSATNRVKFSVPIMLPSHAPRP